MKKGKLDRLQWEQLSIQEKIKIFMTKYNKRDKRLLYNISEHFRYQRFGGEVIFYNDHIQHFVNVNIEKFAEDWCKHCDENLEPLIVYEAISDEEIEDAIKYGKDFIISHKINYSISKWEDVLRLYGERSIYTSDFGPYITYKDTDVHEHFFTCNCEHLKGKPNLGLTCPICGTPVSERDFSVDKFGHMKSDYDVRFLTPVGYAVLSRILNIGKAKVGILDYIMGARRTKETNAHKIAAKIAAKYKKKYLYEEVENLIDEVLGVKKVQKYKKLIDFFLSNKDRMFRKYIPVISTAFRKLSYTTTFGVDKIEAHNDLNHVYVSISTALMHMDLNYESNNRYTYYYLVTKGIVDLYNAIFTLLGKGKKSYIRSCVMGQRQNNVIMAVLEPLSRGLTEDQCIVSYRHLMALKSREIEVFLLSKDIPAHEAHLMMNHNNIVDGKVKPFLEAYIREHMVIIEYNRQPTIRMQSSLALTVVGLSDKPVLFVHPTTAKKPNADHDKYLSRLPLQGLDVITLRIAGNS